MRILLVVLALVLGVILLGGCGGDDGEKEGPPTATAAAPTATAVAATSTPRGETSPSASASPSLSSTVPPAETVAPAIGSYTDRFDFRSFGAQLDDALRAADVQFFLDTVSFEELTCTEGGFPDAPAACAGQPLGSTVPGIPVDVFTSEGFGLDAASYERFMEEFLNNIDSGASDAYGDGKPRLYAYAVFNAEFQQPSAAQETVEAIAIRIAGPRPVQSQIPGSPLQRQAVLFSSSFDGQRWAITHLATGPTSYFIDPTDPNAKNLFQFWQRWE